MGSLGVRNAINSDTGFLYYTEAIARVNIDSGGALIATVRQYAFIDIHANGRKGEGEGVDRHRWRAHPG